VPTLPADVAQKSFPSFVISDDDGAHLCPALERELPSNNPASRAYKFRHSLPDSMLWLGLMLVVLVSAVIAILRRRDHDPQ
jgi:hypothetical protein